MKRLTLCLLFLLAMILAGCEEGEREERRIQIADQPQQQIQVTVAQ